MKIITFDDIKKAYITPDEVYRWTEEVIEHKADCILPAKISIQPQGMDGVFYNTMPCVIPKENVAGVKLVTRYPSNKPTLDSQLMLCELNSGNRLALIDANYITALRTGAVAVHSMEKLAKWGSGSTTVGIMGLGNVMLANIFPNRDFQLKTLEYKTQHLLIKEEFSKYKNLHFIFVKTHEELVDGSDIIISAATYIKENVCEDKYYKKGVTVIPIHTRGFCNCDLFFDKVFADDTNHVRSFKYFNKFKYFAEVSDVINGKSAGRENDDERILVYNIGIAPLDIYFAKKIYNKLKDSVQDIDMHLPEEKYWF